MDKEVELFAKAMQAELDANKPKKGDWKFVKKLSKLELIRELDHHRDKLVRILTNAPSLFEDTNSDALDMVMEFSADVANCAMFIAYAHNLLNTDDFSSNTNI
jgi:hypothetical protein